MLINERLLVCLDDLSLKMVPHRTVRMETSFFSVLTRLGLLERIEFEYFHFQMKKGEYSSEKLKTPELSSRISAWVTSLPLKQVQSFRTRALKLN